MYKSTSIGFKLFDSAVIISFSLTKAFTYLLIASAILTVCNVWEEWGLPFWVMISPLLFIPGIIFLGLISLAILCACTLLLFYMADTSFRFDKPLPPPEPPSEFKGPTPKIS